MADKTYKLTFALSNGTSQDVQFTAPQGPKGDTGETGPQGPKGEVENFIHLGDDEPTSGPILWFDTTNSTD